MDKVVINLWCNQYNSNAFKAFMSALSLEVNYDYHKVDIATQADLWCLIDDESKSEAERLVPIYDDMNVKPKVVYLARTFHAPPVSEWVFFKSPLNVSVLINWVNAQNFSHTQQNDYRQDNSDVKLTAQSSEQRDTTASISTINTHQRWKSEHFKFSYWPNVTQYSDSPEIMIICTTLLRDWSTYQNLPTTTLPATIINQMLIDAEAEGNLIYRSAESGDEALASKSAKNEQEDSQEDQNSRSDNHKKDAGWGFFKSLFNRFVS